MRDSRSVLLPTRESEMGPRSAGSYCDLVRPSFPSSPGSRAPTPSLLSSLTGWAPPATGSCARPAAPCISGPCIPPRHSTSLKKMYVLRGSMTNTTVKFETRPRRRFVVRLFDETIPSSILVVYVRGNEINGSSSLNVYRCFSILCNGYFGKWKCGKYLTRKYRSREFLSTKEFLV